MLFRTTVAALVLMGSCTLARAGDPVGHYSIEGKNPDGDGAYSGSVEVTRTGDTFKVVWSVGDDTYIGTAIGNDEFLAVSYKSGSNSGLALYNAKGSSWDGIWTYAGGRKLGLESWTRE